MAMDVEQIRAYIEYFRDLGVYDFYRTGEPIASLEDERAAGLAVAGPVGSEEPRSKISRAPDVAVVATKGRAELRPREPDAAENLAAEHLAAESLAAERVEPAIGKLISFNDLAELPEVRVARPDRATALAEIRQEIGDCTRCPLAYAGRRTIVFGDGDANARIMFVGEGPGADEDVTGVPFVGKAGQLLNNMIGAMGLKREQVYIANVVKCRPPGNRVPEPVEANTCSQFLLRQMDVVQPEVVVALGATAATYLLGVKQSLSSLRGRWHAVRGAKLVVTYHPAFLLRDPRQKGEAWKDLQMAMKELGLSAPAKV